MPGKRHLHGVGEKEQRQYDHILQSARGEGRYGKRAKEVAARTVMKQHNRKGIVLGSESVPTRPVPTCMFVFGGAVSRHSSPRLPTSGVSAGTA